MPEAAPSLLCALELSPLKEPAAIDTLLLCLMVPWLYVIEGQGNPDLICIGSMGALQATPGPTGCRGWIVRRPWTSQLHLKPTPSKLTTDLCRPQPSRLASQVCSLLTLLPQEQPLGTCSTASICRRVAWCSTSLLTQKWCSTLMQVCAASGNQQLMQAAETLYPLVSSPFVQGGPQH